MSFVLTQCVVTFSGYVCVRETGLLPRPYHAKPFCRIFQPPGFRHKLQAAGYVFNPVTQARHMGRRWFSEPFFAIGDDSPPIVAYVNTTFFRNS